MIDGHDEHAPAKGQQLRCGFIASVQEMRKEKEKIEVDTTVIKVT